MSGCELGRIFQIETLGAVDGPGLRFVLFLQGCPLRCPYCHNPESWGRVGGSLITVEQVLEKVKRYRSYYRGGGLTVSGGEPLLQAGFVRSLFRRCREEGLHTALDTSGCVEGPEAWETCEAADLLLLDVKTADPALHRERFGFPLDRVAALLDRCEDADKPVWIRHVVAPGLTDTAEGIRALAAFLRGRRCVRRIELLPFRDLCLEKYRRRGIPFPLEKAGSLHEEDLAGLVSILRERLPGVPVSP
jgi:pyruvate formate lyase activating enzyme